MKARWRIAVLASALAGGCAHTKSTDEGAAARDEQDQKEAGKTTKPESRRTGGTGAHEAGGQGAGKHATVPVASAPEALLAPGAEKKIREKLAADGFMGRDAETSDASMREGIRRFQRAKDLPATGVADQETVKRLGLDPDQIFRRGTVKD
jgi:hypothetical protein